jgi:hypothetical protein
MKSANDDMQMMTAHVDDLLVMLRDIGGMSAERAEAAVHALGNLCTSLSNAVENAS